MFERIVVFAIDLFGIGKALVEALVRFGIGPVGG